MWTTYESVRSIAYYTLPDLLDAGEPVLHCTTKAFGQSFAHVRQELGDEETILELPSTPAKDPSPGQEVDRGLNSRTLILTGDTTPTERDSQQIASKKAAETGNKTQAIELGFFRHKVRALE